MYWNKYNRSSLYLIVKNIALKIFIISEYQIIEEIFLLLQSWIEHILRDWRTFHTRKYIFCFTPRYYSVTFIDSSCRIWSVEVLLQFGSTNDAFTCNDSVYHTQLPAVNHLRLHDPESENSLRLKSVWPYNLRF